jgi:hypothetical protein
MNSSMLRTSMLLVALAGAAGCESPPASQSEAQAAADRWATDHASGWELKVDDKTQGFVQPFGARCATDFMTLRYAAAGYQVDLGFACPGPQGTDLAGLRASFKYAVLDVLPHGVEVPGWNFQVLTPSSSITAGVQLASWDGGRLTVKIDTALFRLSGTRDSADCMPPADGTTPAACLAGADLHQMPVHLTLTAPLSPELLKGP